MNKLKQWVNKLREEDKELIEALKKTEFEKRDAWALIIAAFITIVPMVLIVLGVFVFVIWFLFLRY